MNFFSSVDLHILHSYIYVYTYILYSYIFIYVYHLCHIYRFKHMYMYTQHYWVIGSLRIDMYAHMYRAYENDNRESGENVAGKTIM